MTPENLLSEWSRLFVESLADAGLRDAVVSPGSRSTPLVWAFLACDRIRCRSVVDERSAAFYAIGHAKVTGRPALLLCTSGSAAANYFPAVVEAALSRTPLIVVTADRPFELLDASAAQTIDQTKIYGAYVRRFADLGMPDAAPAALVGLRRRAVQALYDAQTPEPGPVHLNFRARKPLEPTEPRTAEAIQLKNRVDELSARPTARLGESQRTASRQVLDEVARDCGATERGIIVCGPTALTRSAAPDSIRRLARRCGFPIYAEATSQMRFSGEGVAEHALDADGLDLLLRAPSFREHFTPEIVVQIGEPPTSGHLDRFVANHPGVRRHVVAEHGWPDPHGTAWSLALGNVEETLRGLLAALGPGGSPTSAWASFVSEANAAAWRSIESLLGEVPALSEGGAMRAIVESLPAGSVLVLGNSLPVRHVDAFVRGGPRRLDVVCQRGASGIDGVVSTAAGAAGAAARPTVLVVGDLSALHDLGGFHVAASTEAPLVVVVLNNDGGRIFEQLPIADLEIGERMRFWTTPHGLHFRGVAELFGFRYEAPDSTFALAKSVASAAAQAGCTLVEVVVPPHGARQMSELLETRLEDALRPLVSR